MTCAGFHLDCDEPIYCRCRLPAEHGFIHVCACGHRWLGPVEELRFNPYAGHADKRLRHEEEERQ